MTQHLISTALGRPALGAGRLSASTPYSWPWDGQFAPGRCALLVVTTTEPSAPGGDPAWLVMTQLRAAAGQAGAIVVPVGTRRPMRLTGADTKIDSNPPGAGAVTAPGWDGFYGTPLDNILRAAGRDLLLLAGSWLETGVHSTLRSANDRGYECLLIADACVSADESTTAGALSSIEMSGGIFGAVAYSGEVLRLLSGDLAEAPYLSDAIEETQS